MLGGGAARAEGGKPDGPALESRAGLYFGAGAGLVAQSIDNQTGDGSTGPELPGVSQAATGFSAELRLGYRFGPRLQLYLSASLSQAAHGGDGGKLTARQTDVLVNLQTPLLHANSLTVYARVGVGPAVASGAIESSPIVVHSSAGLGEIFALGLGLRVGGAVTLAPEFFYRRSADWSGSQLFSDGASLGPTSCFGVSLNLLGG